jgi:nucleoside-diphosphate-sugar epimerase
VAKPVIAITGATGFIGGRILRRLLDDGYAVRALARTIPQDTAEFRSAAADPDALRWIKGGLDDPSALESLVDGASVVVHCAGAIKARSRDAFFDINAGGTRRLAEAAAAKSEPPRFLHISSLAAREPSLSAYAASKRAGEQMIRGFQALLRPVILRPPAVYGPGDGETLRVFKLARRGIFPVPVGSGRVSLVHVDDVAAAVGAVLRSDVSHAQPIEFDDGKAGGYDWTDLAAAAGAAVGTKPRIVQIPSLALYGAGAVGSLAMRLSGRPSVFSWGKIAELLHPDWVAAGPGIDGYTPQWGIEKGFENTAKWYVSRGMLKSNG